MQTVDILNKTFMDTKISRLKLCCIAAPYYKHIRQIYFLFYNYSYQIVIF